MPISTTTCVLFSFRSKSKSKVVSFRRASAASAPRGTRGVQVHYCISRVTLRMSSSHPYRSSSSSSAQADFQVESSNSYSGSGFSFMRLFRTLGSCSCSLFGHSTQLKDTSKGRQAQSRAAFTDVATANGNAHSTHAPSKRESTNKKKASFLRKRHASKPQAASVSAGAAASSSTSAHANGKEPRETDRASTSANRKRSATARSGISNRWARRTKETSRAIRSTCGVRTSTEHASFLAVHRPRMEGTASACRATRTTFSDLTP